MKRYCLQVASRLRYWNGFGQMLSRNALGVIKIGDGARNFQHPSIRSPVSS
jgi:hypothetical protein